MAPKITVMREQKIVVYDEDYSIRECVKCGRVSGVKLSYCKSRDLLMVSCNECGYSYGMLPMDRNTSI